MKKLTRPLSGALALTLLLAALAGGASLAAAAPLLKLFTPYTYLSVSPGETISYSVDVINDSDEIRSADVTLDVGSLDWKYELTAGGNRIRQISVKPGESQTLSLSLTVPLEVNKGDYSFKLNAGDFGTLPLKVNVAEQGSYKSELSVDQPNREGHADSKFTYSLTLDNRTASEQQYALSAEAPAGWDVRFSVSGSNVTSVDVDPGNSKTISLDVTPAENAAADTYPIVVQAASGSSSAQAQVEAAITGSYGLTLSTSDERLSADITAGKTRNLELVVKNTGSAELTDVSLSGQLPANWEVTFEPKTIRSIAAGQSVPVTATVKASDKALAGDYVANLTASSTEKTASAMLRITVETSVLWGWIGVLIVLVVLAGIYGLFRKYGRR
ncbi:NEW3 domain-containing protein [Cohnella cellulosilytica]|uniref:NEW3 domain-containing protein n=1 Tax=Cohnella cellulosilytica TaxID=986710 RepID=A0ABW2F4A6_9BACL